MKDEWIATEWTRKSDADSLEVIPITIHRTISPFYSGVKFAVRRGGMCLTIHGDWIFEPQPSSRTDAFYWDCRFSSFDAAAMAVKKCEKKLE